MPTPDDPEEAGLIELNIEVAVERARRRPFIG